VKIPRAIACAAALLCAGFAYGEDTGAPSGQAAMLQAQYAEFRGEPVESRFHRPLRIESSEGKQAIAGQIHALVDSPYAVTVAALKDPSHWCEILLLHLDTKDCHVFSEDGGTALRMGVVTHYDQPPSSAFSATFKYHVAEETRDFLDVRLDAAKGPMGTSNYLIVLEAMPAEGGQTFIRMSYSYAYGVMAKIAMSAYFLTFGRGKKGAISHIGIYVGNGRIVHASTKAHEVIETDLMNPKVAGVKRWRGARRVLTNDGMVAAAGDSVS